MELFKNKALFPEINDYILCPVFRKGEITYNDIKDAFRTRFMTLLIDATRELRSAISNKSGGEVSELHTQVYTGVCDQINDALDLDVPIQADNVADITAKVMQTDNSETFLRKIRVNYDEIRGKDRLASLVKREEPDTPEDREFYEEVEYKVEDADLAIFLEALRTVITH